MTVAKASGRDLKLRRKDKKNGAVIHSEDWTDNDFNDLIVRVRQKEIEDIDNPRNTSNDDLYYERRSRVTIKSTNAAEKGGIPFVPLEVEAEIGLNNARGQRNDDLLARGGRGRDKIKQRGGRGDDHPVPLVVVAETRSISVAVEVVTSFARGGAGNDKIKQRGRRGNDWLRCNRRQWRWWYRSAQRRGPDVLRATAAVEVRGKHGWFNSQRWSRDRSNERCASTCDRSRRTRTLQWSSPRQQGHDWCSMFIVHTIMWGQNTVGRQTAATVQRQKISQGDFNNAFKIVRRVGLNARRCR